jgi:hypothetical protein
MIWRITKADGSIASWGYAEYGGIGAPSGKGYTKIYSDKATFIALKADGSITAWGYSERDGACLHYPIYPTP